MRWSYKTVHYELKKEGILGNSFLDEPEIELSLNQYGKAGWELVSLLETIDGLIAVFKQPLDLDMRSLSSPTRSTEKIAPEKIVRSSRGTEEKTQAVTPRIEEEVDLEIVDDDMAEPILLDEFEVVEEKVKEAITKPKKPADAGSIRIE